MATWPSCAQWMSSEESRRHSSLQLALPLSFFLALWYTFPSRSIMLEKPHCDEIKIIHLTGVTVIWQQLYKCRDRRRNLWWRCRLLLPGYAATFWILLSTTFLLLGEWDIFMVGFGFSGKTEQQDREFLGFGSRWSAGMTLVGCCYVIASSLDLSHNA